MPVVTPMARTQTIAFLSSDAKEANEALEKLASLYGNTRLIRPTSSSPSGAMA